MFICILFSYRNLTFNFALTVFVRSVLYLTSHKTLNIHSNDVCLYLVWLVLTIWKQNTKYTVKHFFVLCSFCHNNLQTSAKTISHFVSLVNPVPKQNVKYPLKQHLFVQCSTCPHNCMFSWRKIIICWLLPQFCFTKGCLKVQNVLYCLWMYLEEKSIRSAFIIVYVYGGVVWRPRSPLSVRVRNTHAVHNVCWWRQVKTPQTCVCAWCMLRGEVKGLRVWECVRVFWQ